MRMVPGTSQLASSTLAVRAVNDEMDDAHRFANRRSPLI